MRLLRASVTLSDCLAAMNRPIQPFRHDLKNNLVTRVFAFDQFVCLLRFTQRKDRGHNRLDVSRINCASHLGQLRTMCLSTNKMGADPVRGGLFVRGRLNQRD
jgi:hypothetical protein